MNKKSIKYRPDIDGLRAVAIIPVVLFHCGWEVISGGFIGVDVFFVISGFLITSIILRELDEGRFVFTEFWLRRVRRIFPALFVVMAVSIVIFSVIYPPNYYRDFAQTVAAQSVFLSNIMFYIESGYFDTESKLKPLLHTWSLSVEEQFYFIFPILLVLITKWARQWRCIIICLLVLSSFVASVVGATHYPSAAFFLLHTRAWELGIGLLLAMAVMYRGELWSNDGINKFLAVLGVLLISGSIFFIDQNTSYPSYWAALPCLGAAALIWSGRKSTTFVNKFLSVPPMVFIGRISYSLYLWHWLALVINRAIRLEEPTFASDAFAVTVSFAISVLSYYFIETPIRKNKTRFTNKRLVVSSLIFTSLLLAFGITGHMTNGLIQRFPKETQLQFAAAIQHNPRRQKCHTTLDFADVVGSICRSGAQSINGRTDLIVFGDSHAASIQPAIEKAATITGSSVVFASYSNCPPTLGVDKFDTSPSHECQIFNESLVNFAITNRIKNALLVLKHSYYLSGTNRKYLFIGMESLVRTLQAGGVHVHVMRDVPNFDVGVAEYFMKATLLQIRGHEPKISIKEYDSGHREFLEFLKSINVSILDMSDKICGKKSCTGYFNDLPGYYDEQHLNLSGATFLVPDIVHFLKQLRDR